MQNYLQNLVKANHSYIMMVALLVKGLVFGVNYPDFLIVTSILGYEGFKLHLKSKQPDPVRIDAKVQAELDALKAKVSGLTMNQSVKATVEKRYF